MALFPRDENGVFDDRVSLELGGDRVLTSSSYDVSIGVLQQPSRFSVKLGMSGSADNAYWSAGDFIKRYPPRTPFRLFIGDALQQTGFTDGQPAVERSSGGTTITVKGRDTLAPLHDGFVAAEISLADESFQSLVEKIAKEAWSVHKAVLGGAIPKVVARNDAGRKIRAGVTLASVTPSSGIGSPEQILQGSITGGGEAVGAATIVQQTKLGSRFLDVLRKYLDRAGLVVSAMPDGNYVVFTPNGHQKPFAKIEVNRGGKMTVDATGGAGNVLSTHYDIDTVSRYSVVDIYGRGGGKKLGRAKSKGASTDPEMVSWGFNKPLVIRDAVCTNVEQAEFLAARKLAEGARQGFTLAEGARQGFTLEYTLSGHTTRALQGGGRAIWTPDTVVQIIDPDLNINGEFYLEHVTFSRNPQAQTALKFMRKQDLVFGGDL